MKLKTRLYYGLQLSLALFLYIFIYSINSATAHAEGISLQVSPDKSLVELTEPNTEKTIHFSLKNNLNHPETVKFMIFPIEKVDNSTNRLVYQSNQSLSKDQQSFYKNAISFSHKGKDVPEILLPPQAQEAIEVKIRYNANQKISEYYFTIGFITRPDDSIREQREDEVEAYLPIQGGVGSHVLVTLGDKVSEVVVSNVEALDSNKSVPDIAITLTNRTSKAARVYGNISISNILGLAIASFDTDDIFLFGSETRTIIIPGHSFTTSPLLSLASIGSNTIKSDLYNPSSGQRTIFENSYLHIPLPLILLPIIIVALVILVRRKLKRKND